MTDLTALDELIKAVEAGEPFANIDFYTPLDCLNDDFDLGLTARSAYNGSLDAAKALHDALLPSVNMDMSIRDGEGSVWVLDPQFKRYPAAWHSPARAWLLAVLKTYRAQIGGAA